MPFTPSTTLGPYAVTASARQSPHCRFAKKIGETVLDYPAGSGLTHES